LDNVGLVDEIFDIDPKLESTLDLTAFIRGVCFNVGELNDDDFEVIPGVLVNPSEVFFWRVVLFTNLLLFLSVDKLPALLLLIPVVDCFSKSCKVCGFSFLTFGVDDGTCIGLAGGLVIALSKIDFKVLIDTPDVNELLEDLWVIDDIEEMVDKLDIDETLDNLMPFIFGLNKDDLASEKFDSQSKKSSVLTDISS